MSLKTSIFNYFYHHSFWWKYYFDNKADRLQASRCYVKLNAVKEPSENVIILFNNEVALNTTNHSGGLADRLKGIVSVYKACRQLNRTFKICHTEPFDMERYLRPNNVDWRISSSDICYDVKRTEVHVLRYIRNPNEEKYHYRRLLKLINKAKKSHKELHLYTNVDMTESFDEFRSLYTELFRPSDILNREIEKNLQAIGQAYVSLSFRFTHLLGDPVDTYMEELADCDKHALMGKMKMVLERMHKKYPCNKLLVNTDSGIFRQYVQKLSLPYVYMNPGVPVHIDQTKDTSDDSFMKTFVDFYMISKAEKVLLVKDAKMYNSAFPRFAAAIGKKPFAVVEV